MMRFPAFLFFLALGVQPLAADEHDPSSLVESVAGHMLNLLDENRAHYAEHPEELATMVKTELLPLFDLERSARLILGRHGRSATPEQVAEFANAMSSLLADRYGEGLLEFRGRDQLQVLPLKGNNTDRLTRVQTRVKLDSGSFAPVDYSFYKSDEGWKAFDVTVEGISYVITYRNQFGPQIQADGLDAVIARLKSGEVEIDE